MAFDGERPKRDASRDRTIAEEVMRDHALMENDRANWETLFQQIAERIFPRADLFQGRVPNQGELRTEKIFDSTAVLALERFSAAVHSLVTPRQDMWALLKPENPDLEDDEDVRLYLEEVNRRLFAARYAPRANFSSNATEVYMSLGAFGTGPMFIDDALGSGLRYRALHLSEICFGEDFQGLVDRVHRKFRLKAYQCEQMFDPESLPDKIKRSIADKKIMDEYDFIHCVKPNPFFDPRRADGEGMPFASYYVSCDGVSIVIERGKNGYGGYRTMPYAVPRYMTGPGETYGRSPAMTVLADIKMSNEMSKTMIRAGQRYVDPPYILADDTSLQPFNLRANALNYGYMNDEGAPKVMQLTPQGSLPIGMDMLEDRRRTINDAFLISLFQILVDNPQMTATEAMFRAQEKGQLLGPAMDRLQGEFLGPMIQRELDILSMAGQFDDLEVPEALMEEGGALQVSYEAPINRMQRTGEAVGIIRTLEVLTPLAQIDPTVLDQFHPHRSAKILAEANGVPQKALRTAEELAALEDERAQNQQAQQLIEAIPAGAKAARDLSQAAAVAGNSPAAIPYIQPGPEF